MNKKDKLKLFLNKLEALDKSSDEFPIDDVANMSDNFINDEVKSISSKLKENVIVKSLDRINEKISKLKQDFDVKPIIELIKELEAEIETSQKSIVDDFENKLTTKVEEVKSLIPEIPEPEPFDDSSLKKDIKTLKDQVLSKKDFDPSGLNKELNSIKTRFEALVKDINSDDTNQTTKKELDKKLEELRRDLLSRLQKTGGGSMNRQIRVEGVDVLTKYTDINLIGASTDITAVNDDTNKRVNITFPSGGAGGVEWGDITGTLSDQTDLQTALDAKAPLASPTFTGIVTLPKTVEIQDTSADHQYVLAVSELAADRTITLPLLLAADTFVFANFIQTLTNKRITKRVVTAADATSVTPNSDNADWTYQLNTQSTGTLTINADAGTPTDAQAWGFKIRSTNVQTFSWNAQFRGGANALPTASSGGSDVDYYTFIWDGVDSTWDYTGSAVTFPS